MALKFMDDVAARLRDRHAADAFFTDGRHYTFGDVARRVSAIQKWIRREAANEQRIGVSTGDGIDTYTSILAILFSGAAYVPLYSENPAERSQEIVRDAELAVILTDHDVQSGAEIERATGCRIFDVRDLEDDLDEPSVAVVDGSDLAYLLFTSGSTGRPKGVPISHDNLNAFLGTTLDADLYDFRSTDRFLQMFELTFDLSVTSFLTPLCVGACCYVVPKHGVAYLEILRLLTEKEISVALMVPSVLSYLEPYFDEIRLPALRYSLFCGEALRADLAGKWSECVPHAEVQNVYGPTEATIFCTVYPMGGGEAEAEAVNGIVSIGTPMPGVSAYVVSSDGDPVDDGVQGELCLGGAQVTSGYWRNPEKSADAFREIRIGSTVERVYRTGDLAYVNENGNLIYCGREDAQVKIDGHRVELGEIEFHAREYCGAAPLVAVVARNPTGGQAIHLFIEGSFDREGLRTYLESRIPSYMVPKHLHGIEAMPINLNGKMDRKALVARLATPT